MTPVAAKNTSSPLHEVVGDEHAVEVVAEVERGAALVVVAGPEPALDRAAEALDARRGDHAFGRAADAEQHVDAGVAPRDRDRAGDVAVLDELDARAGLAALADDVGVALAVEDRPR